MSTHAVHQAVDLVGFLMLGLVGGFGHCVGMCSPFVLFVSRRYAPDGAGRGAVFVAQGWYAAGRLVTYTALGALAGAVGALVQQGGASLGLQRAAWVLAGAVLVSWSLLSGLEWVLPPRAGAGSRPVGSVSARLFGFLRGRVPRHAFVTGLLLGLLPCGFLYSAVVAAVARGNPVQGGVAMTVFGLATVPALLTVSFADEMLGVRRRAVLNALARLFILAMGLRFLWRGLF